MWGHHRAAASLHTHTHKWEIYKADLFVYTHINSYDLRKRESLFSGKFQSCHVTVLGHLNMCVCVHACESMSGEEKGRTREEAGQITLLTY